MYSGARIIHTKIRENLCELSRICELSMYRSQREAYTCVRITIVQIIWDVRINEGQIIRATLYASLPWLLVWKINTSSCIGYLTIQPPFF